LSTLDELNESLDNQDKQDDELLGTIKNLNLLAPRLEERRIERDAKRNLINTAPVVFIEEFAPRLLQFEKDDEEKLRSSIPGLAASAKNVLIAVDSTGGTVSPYVSGTYSYVSAANEPNPWLVTAMQPFEYLATYKLQRTEIPMKLNKLYQGLGDLFSSALQSTDKAKFELEHQSDSIMAMRNFLINFWGNLLDLARQTKPSIWRGFQRKKLSQPGTRDLVSKSLSNNPSDERKLVQLLQNLADLSSEMSSPQVGKNLGLDDLPLLNALFTRWLLLIDDLVRILQIEMS
jgi:hypothetical protein